MEENKSCKSLRLLFLDIDGTANSGADNCSPNRHIYNDRFSHTIPRKDGKGTCELTYVDPILAARISKLVEDFDLYIVVSSSWRLYWSLEDFKELLTLRGLPGERLIGYTPNLYRNSAFFGGGCPRSEEVKAFLSNFTQPVEKYIILDDLEEARFDTDKGKLFLTDFDTGYTEEIDKQVRAYLKGD